MTDNELVHICAFRYALGRRSYIVGFMAERLRHLCQEGGLSQAARELIVREIDEHRQMFGNLGHDCDRRSWESLQKHLRNFKEGGKDKDDKTSHS